MFTLAAYGASIANGSVYAAVAGANDPVLTRDPANNFLFQNRMQIRVAYVQSANLTAARINAPSLRSVALPEIYPTVVAAAPPTNPAIFFPWDNGPTIQPLEGVGVDISRGGAGAADCQAGLWLFDGFQPASKGPVTTLVATSTIVQVANGWVSGSLTFATTIGQGQFEVVGMNVVANDVAFARLIFPQTPQIRPGCLADAAYGNKVIPNIFGPGMLGKWGNFRSTALPNIETFGIVAGSEPVTAYLHVVKVGNA